MIDAAADLNIVLLNTPKDVGRFIHRHRPRFKRDGVEIETINNGTASYIYRIHKSTIHTIHTIHENESITIHDFEKPSKQEALEIPFL